MSRLLLLALLAQTADAALTCRTLAQPGHREWNRVMGATCGQIVTRKALIGGVPLVLLRGRARTAWTIGLTAAGGVGVGVTVALR